MPGRTPEAEPLLTPAEVAAMFRVDPKTVTRWAQAGKLTSIRTLGGHRRYRETEVRALLAGIPQQRTEAPRDPMKAPVHTLWAAGAPGAVHSRLRGASIATVGELITASADDLKSMGLRPAEIDEVRLALYRKGLALHGDVLGEVA